MTAPIVWHETRAPIPPRDLRALSFRASLTKRRAQHRPSAGTDVIGGLWEREAERDVSVHGEPQWPFLSHRLSAMIDRVGIDNPADFLRALMDNRRSFRGIR